MQNQNDQIIHWRILEKNGTCKNLKKKKKNGGGGHIINFSACQIIPCILSPVIYIHISKANSSSCKVIYFNNNRKYKCLSIKSDQRG